MVGVAAGCDIAREDAGQLAAIVMGLAVANMDGFDIPVTLLSGWGDAGSGLDAVGS